MNVFTEETLCSAICGDVAAVECLLKAGLPCDSPEAMEFLMGYCGLLIEELGETAFQPVTLESYHKARIVLCDVADEVLTRVSGPLTPKREGLVDGFRMWSRKRCRNGIRHRSAETIAEIPEYEPHSMEPRLIMSMLKDEIPKSVIDLTLKNHWSVGKLILEQPWLAVVLILEG